MDDIEEFKGAIRAHGLNPPEIIEPGKLHRFPTNCRASDDAGWCKLFPDCEGGVFGDFRSGLSETWQAQRKKPFTSAEREAFRQRCEAERCARQAEEARRHAEAAKKARSVWAAATSLREPHPHLYLLKKGVAPVPELREIHADAVKEIIGYRPQSRDEFLVGRLLVARIQAGDELVSVEFIDELGRKSALAGGPKKGGYWAAQPLPKGNGAGHTILVGEGIATSLSAREATGYLAVAALSSSNMMAVARALRERYPKAKLGFLADLLDTGLPDPHAAEAAAAVSGRVAVPDFGPDRPKGLNDFNDLVQHRGLDAAAACIAAQMAGPDEEQGKKQGANRKRRKARTAPGLTDLGNAHRFAREHQTDTRYCWPWQKWLIWNSRCWAHDDSGAVHRLAEKTVLGMYHEVAAESSMPRREALSKWALKSEAHDRRVKMLASGRAIEGIPVRPGELDRDPMLLNCRNGTLDLRTGDLRTHRREDYLTRGLDLDYDPDARCPTWELFLLQVFAGDVGLVEFLQRALGHSLTGDVREDSFFILQGGGGNGKSTLLYIVHGLLGAYAGRIPSELLMVRRGEHHPTEKATLYGKRFVSASETSEGCRLSEEMVKVLTSIDPIPCRRMREDYWEFIPTHKLWLSTNHRPKIRGTDHAIWRRIHLIPFGVTFHEPETGKTPQKDLTLPERLLKELPGILSWAVRGCLDWQREGLKTPKAVLDATEGYRAEMDVLAAFLRECCVLDKRAEARASDLFSAYKGWCKANFEHAESQKGFGTRLGERGLTSRKSHGRMIYQGIGLLAGEDGEDGDRVSVSHTRANLYIEEPRSRSPSSPSSPEDGDRHCWSCRGAIDDDDADRCPTCGWFICSCGACDPECSERDSGRL